jgi:hypothetical protein
MKVKSAKNNPNRKPNVPLEIEKDPHFVAFVPTVLPHTWGKARRFTLFYLLCNFPCQDVLLSSVQDVIGCFNSQRS